MNNKFLINFTPGTTTIHKLTGGTKVLLFILFTIAIIATFDVRVIAVLAIFPVAAIISMKPNYKPIRFMIGFMFVVVGLFGSLMLLLVSPNAGLTNVGGSTVIWRISERLYLTKETLWYIFAMFFKRLASFMVVIAFVLATTPSEFASGLAFLHVPYKICTIVSLAYRTIPDIARKYTDIKNSMQMRGVELSKKAPLGKRLKATAALLVPLIISSFGKVETIANAMDLRGFGRLKKRTWYAEHELTKADKILRKLCIVFAVLIVFYIVYFRFINPWPATYWSPFIAKDEIQKVSIFNDLFILKWFGVN
jgi:energy-coupling factor transport system permease protein